MCRQILMYYKMLVHCVFSSLLPHCLYRYHLHTLPTCLHEYFSLSTGRSALACLACGPQLEVVNPITGERLSAYHFSGVNEQPPTILAVKEFSWQKRTGLLIGLEETEGSVLCLYDLGISRVVKAVVLPGRVHDFLKSGKHDFCSAEYL